MPIPGKSFPQSLASSHLTTCALNPVPFCPSKIPRSGSIRTGVQNDLFCRNGSVQESGLSDLLPKTGPDFRVAVFYFRNPSLKSKTCARSQSPDCLWSKRFLESMNSSLNTTGYAKVQKPDLPPLKGVGDLPAKRGRIATYPWASFWDPSLGPNPNPTTATRSAKNMIAVVFRPSSQPKKGDHRWLT